MIYWTWLGCVVFRIKLCTHTHSCCLADRCVWDETVSDAIVPDFSTHRQLAGGEKGPSLAHIIKVHQFNVCLVHNGLIIPPWVRHYPTVICHRSIVVLLIRFFFGGRSKWEEPVSLHIKDANQSSNLLLRRHATISGGAPWGCCAQLLIIFQKYISWRIIFIPSLLCVQKSDVSGPISDSLSSFNPAVDLEDDLPVLNTQFFLNSERLKRCPGHPSDILMFDLG